MRVLYNDMNGQCVGKEILSISSNGMYNLSITYLDETQKVNQTCQIVKSEFKIDTSFEINVRDLIYQCANLGFLDLTYCAEQIL